MNLKWGGFCGWIAALDVPENRDDPENGDDLRNSAPPGSSVPPARAEEAVHRTTTIRYQKCKSMTS